MLTWIAAIFRRNVGFTLLELSLVLFIIGLLTVVFLPQFGTFGQARLEASARRIAALARYLNGQAAFTGRVYRLDYNLDQESYSVSVLTATQEKAEFVPDQSPLTRSVELPTAITFADVRVPNVGRVSTGQAFTHFYPQGYVDPTVIHLRDANARVMTVTIPPLTGEARAQEGYVDAMAQR
jgi:general secretion pathway protein H